MKTFLAMLAMALGLATAANAQNTLEKPLPAPYAAPEFAAIAQWINSKPLSIQGLRGKVVLVDFWDYSCVNCIRTLPYVAQWDRDYRDKGLVVIGVHTPEFSFAKNPENVAAAVAKHKITYPVALDNEYQTWANFHNRYWPAHYLIDPQGRVVYTHFGEGEYDVMEHNIRALLGLGAAQSKADSPNATSAENQTPETYLGAKRMKRFASTQEVTLGQGQKFEFPTQLSLHQWALQGGWKIEDERAVAQSKDAALRIRFAAKDVFLVLGSEDDKTRQVRVMLNGQPIAAAAGKDVLSGAALVKSQTIYHLVHQHSPSQGVLEIQAEPGVTAYAFTFG